MAKLRGPLLAQLAAGSLGDTVVYSSWKGRPYVKRHRRPSQPRTDRQIATRRWLDHLAHTWGQLYASEKASWVNNCPDAAADPYRWFLGLNLARLARGQTPSDSYPTADGVGAADYTITAVLGYEHEIQVNWTVNTYQYGRAFIVACQRSLGAPSDYYTVRGIKRGFNPGSYTIRFNTLQAGDYYLYTCYQRVNGPHSVWVYAGMVTVGPP